MSDAANKRGAERVENDGEIQGEVMVYERLTLKEISQTGARIETPFPLHLDSLHDVRLTLGDRAVVVKARVAHCSIADVGQQTVIYQSGLEFVEPADRVFQTIVEFIERVRRKRDEPT